MSESRVYIRKVQSTDKKELLEIAQSGRAFHDPWISPPLTSHIFKLYLRRTQRDDHEGLLLCSKADHGIVGVLNINTIVRGSFLSASLGYYVAREHTGKGYMREGVELIKTYAFEDLGLHRIEANIQPDNERSIHLVKSCGFEYEGVSKQFLFINGRWRDHERWAAFDPRATLAQSS